jgi:hypothetical protein
MATIRERLGRLDQRFQRPAADGTKPVGADDQVREATRDTFTWVTQHAKTYNEHWVEEGRPDPYECFPADPYLAATFELLDAESVLWFEKSRDMMLSWACVAYLTRQAMTVPFRGILFQTQKEDKVSQLIDYVSLQDAATLVAGSIPTLEIDREARRTGIAICQRQLYRWHPWWRRPDPLLPSVGLPER